MPNGIFYSFDLFMHFINYYFEFWFGFLLLIYNFTSFEVVTIILIFLFTLVAINMYRFVPISAVSCDLAGI